MGQRRAHQLPIAFLFASSIAQFCSISSSSFFLIIIMSGCGNANCGCGSSCTCGDGCSCSRTMIEPTFGGLRNYNMEGDCKCGPNCNCADCQCHK